ncbi:SOS response-associated peptidase [Polaribacter sp.]|uniref:SOS response-associated peptidase n=1 Tax=Polaribacter sp. TaxID=1920175 RepID=UPI003F69EE0F
MCYHVSLTKSKPEIQNRFKTTFKNPDLFEPYYHLNGFSNANGFIITSENHQIDKAKWGLKPENFTEQQLFNLNTLNAKSETVFQSPLFSEPIIKRRCLVLADGFYESKHINGKKFPHYIYLEKNSLFAFAGIYNYENNGAINFSILTISANLFMANIHNSKKRMPIIIDDDFEKDWLNHSLKENEVKELVASCFTKKELKAHSVSKDLHSKRETNSKEILKPVYYQELNTLFD